MSGNQILAVALTTVPTMLVVLIGILINNSRLTDMSSRISDMNTRIGDMNTRIGDMNTRISDMNTRIGELRSHMDARFDDMRDTWRSELHRVDQRITRRIT